MSGPKLSLRLSPGQGDGEEMVQDGIVVDLPSSSKFGFAWPAESTPPVYPPPTSERPVSLSSSEGESDLSEGESSSPAGKHAQTDQSDASDITPTARRKSGREAIAEEPQAVRGLPRFSRAFSMPLPSQLGHLQHPHRGVLSDSGSPSSPIPEQAPEYSQFHELSLELADSVQMMIQTLLQVSPPQVLDTAKEQFSACSLSVPTPSMSAMFTTMKNLNYISANMAKFCAEPSGPDLVMPHSSNASPAFNDFDIGEMLQSVGDALSGAASQAGVDLVLFHGDVGIKHILVRGDENGVSYALSHVIRQVISTAHAGDSIELGLFITSPMRARQETAAPSVDGLSSASVDRELHGPLRCTFEVAHKFAPSDNSNPPGGTPLDSFPPPVRPQPVLDTLLLRRLLSQLGASLNADLTPKIFTLGRACSLTVDLERGSPSTAATPALTEQIPYQLFSDLRIASEPTLDELIQFMETLKGKKVTLYASSKGSFAHHLTSYLTAWGLDVSHVSSEPGVEGGGDPGEIPSMEAGVHHQTTMAPLNASFGAPLEDFAPQGLPPQVSPPFASVKIEGGQIGPQPLSFIFIDDDINVLRERLQKLRAEQPYQLHLHHSRKRPSLAPHHRPKSSPQVARAMGLAPLPPIPSSAVVVVHFTSLANYKAAKDVIQSVLALHTGPSNLMPEVMIIPKPAGPRRFLTALHTAVTKPIVDPFFTPIATSPVSPGHTPSFYNPSNSNNTSPKSPPVRPSGASRTNSDRSGRSPKESTTDPTHLPPPSPLGMPDGMEYFSEAAVKLGSSPSSGLVIQSPDGQPAGIFFHPRARNAKVSSASSVVMERDKGQLLVPSGRSRGSKSRRLSDERRSPQGNISFSALHSASASPRPQLGVDTEGIGDTRGSSQSTPKPKGGKPNSPGPQAEDPPTGGLQSPTAPTPRRPSPMELMRKIATPPGSPLNETSSNSNHLTRRPTTRRAADNKATTPPAVSKKGKGPADANIVPPISVLIVDDNPINQTILSTFMKKKKIKYDVAKNGEEAVQKWRTGGFHLILMDIQMPVMDGIQATKEIRRMEKVNALAGYPPTPSEEQRTPLRTPSDTDSRSSASPYRSSVIIVALTASSLQSDRVAALAAGCNDFLTKPVSLLWLNNKIIEWGSIKALQMWADLRPEVVKSITTDQAVQAQNVARRLHVPEGRRTPSGSPSRSSSIPRSALPTDTPTSTTSTTEFGKRTRQSPSGYADAVESQLSTESSANSSEPSPAAISGADAPVELKGPDTTDLASNPEPPLSSSVHAPDDSVEPPVDELPSIPPASDRDAPPPVAPQPIH